MPPLFLLVAFQQTFPLNKRTWAHMEHKIYRKSAGCWINFKSNKLFQYIKAPPQDQQDLQKGQCGQMFWWVLTQRHIAYILSRLASVFRLLASKTTEIKAWEIVCTKILKQELTSVSAVAYIPLSASELARVVEVKLGGKEDSVKPLGITITPTG